MNRARTLGDEVALPPHGPAPPLQRFNGDLPCRICGEPTPRETHSNFGARCGVCFGAYRRAAFEQREPSPRALTIQAEIAAIKAQR